MMLEQKLFEPGDRPLGDANALCYRIRDLMRGMEPGEYELKKILGEYKRAFPNERVNILAVNAAVNMLEAMGDVEFRRDADGMRTLKYVRLLRDDRP